jgi:hypothetical protein
MNRPRIPLASMTVSLWCAVAAAAQTQSASALPETLLVHLKNERLDVVTLSEGCRSGPGGLADVVRQSDWISPSPAPPFRTDVVPTPHLVAGKRETGELERLPLQAVRPLSDLAAVAAGGQGGGHRASRRHAWPAEPRRSARGAARLPCAPRRIAPPRSARPGLVPHACGRGFRRCAAPVVSPAPVSAGPHSRSPAP